MKNIARFAGLAASLALSGCGALVSFTDVFPVTADDAGGDGAVNPAKDGAAADAPFPVDAHVDSTLGDAGGDSSADAGTDAARDATLTDASGDSGKPSPDGSVCANSCSIGATLCNDGGVLACEAQDGGCPGWMPSISCGAHQTCGTAADGGAAACACSTTSCSQPGQMCLNGALVTCANDDAGCLYQVGVPTTCPGAEVCGGKAPDAGCSLNCQDTCNSGGTVCADGGVETCALMDSGCYDYGPSVACADPNMACGGPAGTSSCSCNTASTCQAVGRECNVGNTGYFTCSKDDAGCWNPPSQVTACSNGACYGTAPSAACCQDVACSAGDQTCDGNGVLQTCTLVNGCTAWVPAAPACTPNQLCTVLTPKTATCVTGCVLDAGYVGPNVPNPHNVCQQCVPTTSTSTWTTVVDDRSCMQSCAAGGSGMNNCGDAGTESCCTSLEVDGGVFYRTYTSLADGGVSAESNQATVSGFRLDKYLVTVGRFRQFVDAVMLPDAGLSWTPPANSGKHSHLNQGNGLNALDGGYEPGWATTDNAHIQPTNANLNCLVSGSTWTAGNDNLPMNCVTWPEAYAFCIWDGAFLPSEAEWEYAAAGGSQQRAYPWGSAPPDVSHAIYGNNYGPTVDAGNNPTLANIAPVGSAAAGAGLWGHLDLVGDLNEVTLDWYGVFGAPCVDCANTSNSSYGVRVIKGGAFQSVAVWLNPPYRDSFYEPPLARGNIFGFRCARTP